MNSSSFPTHVSKLLLLPLLLITLNAGPAFGMLHRLTRVASNAASGASEFAQTLRQQFTGAAQNYKPKVLQINSSKMDIESGVQYCPQCMRSIEIIKPEWANGISGTKDTTPRVALFTKANNHYGEDANCCNAHVQTQYPERIQVVGPDDWRWVDEQNMVIEGSSARELFGHLTKTEPLE